MRSGVVIVAAVFALVAAAAILVYAVDIDVTDSGEMPTAEVNVDVEGGALPEADVDTAEVEVGSEKREVTVPDVDVTMEERSVEMPTVELEPADADEGARSGG